MSKCGHLESSIQTLTDEKATILMELDTSNKDLKQLSEKHESVEHELSILKMQLEENQQLLVLKQQEKDVSMCIHCICIHLCTCVYMYICLHVHVNCIELYLHVNHELFTRYMYMLFGLGYGNSTESNIERARKNCKTFVYVYHSRHFCVNVLYFVHLKSNSLLVMVVHA